MLPSGTRLGPYEVLGLIGEGGIGQVSRAADTRLDRAVAIKVMPAALAGDPVRRERFEREARSISRLEHPNICPLYDVGGCRWKPALENLNHVAFLQANVTVAVVHTWAARVE